jgi:Putative lumazine-binding
MRRYALGFCLFSLLSISFAATKPEVSNVSNDAQAVRVTVTDYIESYYAGDAARMEKSLHPHYLKHVIKSSDGSLKMTEKTGLQMVEDVRSHGPSDLPKSEQTEQITVLDVSKDTASAKLVTSHWVDYMTLAKWNGEWKIVSVVLREND